MFQAKQFHLKWHDKFHDYVDERRKLAKLGLTEAEIRRQRRHLNPSELARKYSSIQSTDDCARAPGVESGGYSVNTDCALVPGLGWARSCLDSKAAWRPTSPDITQWMEIDLGEETSILGLVTQGQAATVEINGRWKSKGAGQANYVTRVCVKYRASLSQPFSKLPEDLNLGNGGDTRHETPFPAPIRTPV